MDVTVLGTGAIGTGMAHSLLRATDRVRSVTVWNRTAARAEPLAADGARVETDLAAAVREAAVVVIIVFDADAVRDVLRRITGSLRADAVVVVSATIGLEIDGVAAQAAAAGVRLVDAPVLGNEGPAERGELSVMAAGDPALRATVTPVLEAVGSKLTWVGDAPGPASRCKLACNAWLSIMNAAMAQAVALADGLGVDPRRYVEVVSGTAADSPFLGYKLPASLGEDDTVLSPVHAIRKDLGLAGAAARATGLPTALLDAVTALYDDATAAGLDDHDMARLVTRLARTSS